MVLNKGLETTQLRWSEKVKVTMERNVPVLATTTLRHRETKSGNGYLASSGLSQVLATKTKPIYQNPTGSNSDMDISSGSDDEAVIRRFVIISSPKGGKFSWLKEDELSDSATSTEISYGYYNSSGIGQNENMENGSRYGDTPSAPPLFESSAQISQSSVDQISSLGGHGASDQNVVSTFHMGKNGSRERTGLSSKVNGSTGSLPVRLPGFQPRLINEQSTFCAVISYDACVRLCLHKWALRGCDEVHCFLENECSKLREAFGLRNVLLQSEDELMEKRSTELVSQVAGQKSRKISGKMKLQVRKVKIGSEPVHALCGLQSLNLPMVENKSLKRHYINFKSTMSSTFKSIKNVRVALQIPANCTVSRRSLAYLQACTEYMKQVSKLLRVGAKNLGNSSSYDQVVQETYCCLLKLKSSSDEDTVRMRPGSGEDHVFFPDGLSDYLVVEVHDSKGRGCGHVLAQVAAIADNPDEKLKWWPIYSDPGHETVGRIQLYINYTTSQNENNHPKCGSVAETTAYDFLLEVAFKDQQFHHRNLVLKEPWRWLVTEFASYYGVSEAYTKLRYLSYVMDVATPTDYCLSFVYDFLSHVLLKGNGKSSLSHQEKRILAETEEQVKDILALVFENYKSLDESSSSGMLEVFMPASGSVAPALAPAVKLYSLLHDILTPEAQSKLCRYFQAATQKRLRRHLAETEEFTLNKNEGALIDHQISYEKMKSLILNIRNEVFTDMKIHNQHVLPSFIELPNVSSSIYSVELSSRLRAFLIACPPPKPSHPVSQLVIAATDFQRDLSLWSVNPVNGGVDVKDLFNSHIIRWIQDKRHELLEICKQDKVKASNIGAKHSTTPFIGEMFDRLVETINEYQVILCRWPEYISLLENAIADIEKGIVEAVEKQFSEVLLPLKDTLTNKIFGHKYVQRLSKGTVNTYLVPDELGVLLNSMRRLLDVLCPKIETQLKSWSSYIQDDGHSVIGEHLNDVKVMLRAKFRSYKQAIVEKLVDNTKVQNATKLKSIIRDAKDTESGVQSRMDPLKDLLTKTILQLNTVVETPLFIQICQELWERMGQDVLHILEDGKEKRSWPYKGLRVAVSILDEVFASEMQKLGANSLQGKDLEPPRSIMEIHSMLCKDAV